MSDQDVFMIATPFGDVAELGQGYVNRADGERILIPLPTECPIGEGVRFIVHLGDGTPAFAGAGRCVQVSDQGEGAAETERFETLLDSLAFDERSQPVYDYIVAVRQAVYAAGGPAADGGESAEAAPSEEEVAAVEAADAGEEVVQEESYAAEAEAEPEAMVETAAVDEPAEMAEPEVDAEPVETAEPEAQVEETYEEAEAEPTRVLSGDEELVSFVDRAESVAPPRAASAAPIAYAEPEPEPMPDVDPSAFVIPAPPSGMLQRATLSVHWQPAPPSFPQASPRSGLFRYPPGPLPVPQSPPRPAMAPSARVSRAPSPS